MMSEEKEERMTPDKGGGRQRRGKRGRRQGRRTLEDEDGEMPSERG
jgi:hypothetical protein